MSFKTPAEILNAIYSNPQVNVFMTPAEALNTTYNQTENALNVNIKNIAEIPTNIIVVANYSALPNPTTVTGKFYWCSNSQGTKWLPFSIGGTYYNSGLYYSNGVSWEYMEVPFQATQLEVDNGIVYDRFVSPLTLENADKWNDIPNLTLEPTGFAQPNDVIVSYNLTNRTITLTGIVNAYWRGKKINSLVSGWISDPHPITVNNYFLYYNGTNFIWDTNPWSLDMLQIAFVSKNGYAVRETHGLMPWQVHLQLHQTVGCYRTAGADFSNYVIGSTVATNRYPHISQTTLKDEDLSTVLSQLITNSYTIRYLISTNTINYTLNSTQIIPLSVNQPYYNQWNGSAWVQTLFSVNAYAAIFVMAIPSTEDATSQSYRYQFIQPQTESTNLATIQSLTPSSINFGDPSFIVPEFNVIGKIIVRYTAGNWSIFSVEKIAGTNNTSVAVQGGFLSGVTTSGLALSGQGTAGSPLTILQRDGFMDYNNSSDGLEYTSGNLKILNNGLGPYTLKTYKPLNITELWNTTTNQFNFSELSLGDEVMIRLDVNIATTAINQEFYFYLQMAVGGTTYTLGDGTYSFKNIGTKQLSISFPFYLGNQDSITYPAELYFNSSNAANLGVNGYYISVRRRVN